MRNIGKRKIENQVVKWGFWLDEKGSVTYDFLESNRCL